MDLAAQILQLSVKMRLLKARHGAGSSVSELKDRDVLILELLSERGSMSVTELCKSFRGIGQSTLSADVKRLRIEKGLVEKTLGREDERVRVISLTESGREKVNELGTQRRKTYAALMKGIGDDPDELEVLETIVERATREIEQELAALECGSE